jgi:hypothetical protein
MLSKMFEESKLKTKIINEINSILGNRNSLSIAFISMDFLNNPGLKLLQEIDELGAFSKKGKKDRELYRFSNGLILESFNFDSMKISDSDGVCLIFDAKKRDSIDPHWNSIVLEIIDALKDNAVVLIGIITKELVNWSKMMGEFDFYTKLEEKQISYFLFNLRSEFRLELYEQLNTLFNTINNI